MKIQFVAGFSPIVADPGAAAALYRDALGIPFERSQGTYTYTHELAGTKHFGLWPLSDAAQACFGTDEWPDTLPVPQATLELEVDDIASAAAELEANGHVLIHGARTEPWDQVIARLMSPDGLLIGICWTPWFHDSA